MMLERGAIGAKVLLSTWERLIEGGGFVTPVLLTVAVCLWALLGLRCLNLRRGTRKDVAALREDRAALPATLLGRAVAAARLARGMGSRGRGRVEEACSRLLLEADQGRRAVLVLTAVAPLLGLLGTVVGMIETFDGLGSMTLFAQSGGVAGGVGQALLSTQVGLVVAVPGLLLGRALDRKQRGLAGEFQRLVELGGADAPSARTKASPVGGA